jgi:1-acyl-sn-glycerol-3-phosphate acyltransferase
MGFHNIEKKSFWYKFLYVYVRFWHDRIFYRKVVVLNYHKVPEKEPLIFTPNHQNALMDALTMLFTVKNQLVFMARSDIFKKYAPILYFLKILPIYRIRDGIDSLKKNKEVFDKTVDVLNAYNGLVILPEGNHKGVRRLRPLKKGFARIAFQTENAGKVKQGIKVVPVGIDYDEYTLCRSRLLVNFGNPIPVSEYIKTYNENPAVGLNLLKNRLAEEIKPLIINIECEKYYDLINELRPLYRKSICVKKGMNPRDEGDGLKADQIFVSYLESAASKNPETISKINDDFNKVKRTLKKAKLSITELFTNATKGSVLLKIIMLVLTFPLFLYGYLNNLLTYQLPYYLSRKVPDKMFHSSFMFVLTMLFFPLFYLLQTVAVFFIFNSWQTALVYLISLPVSAVVAWKWKNLYQKTVSDLRKIKFYKTKDFTETTNRLNNIIQILNKLTGTKIAFEK